MYAPRQSRYSKGRMHPILTVLVVASALIPSFAYAQTRSAGRIECPFLEERLPPPDGHRTSLADDRVVIAAPNRPLLLGQCSEISLQLTTKGLVSINVKQDIEDDPFDRIFGGIANVPVLQHENGDYYIEVIPLRLGRSRLSLFGRFPDGGIFSKRLSILTEPPVQVPKKLVVGTGTSPDRSTPKLRMHLDPPNTAFLVPDATYEGLNQILRIDAHFAQFSIRASRDKPILRIDPATGRITPLAAGDAIVDTSYGGRTVPTCVVVTPSPADSAKDHSFCSELLRPGEKLPDFD